MASAGGGPENVFQHTDPFHDDEVQHQHEAEAAPRADSVDDAEQLRLAGVRSHNPFASEDEHAHGGGNSDMDSDVLARRDQAGIDRVITHNSDQIPAPSPISAISPGAAISEGQALNQTLSGEAIEEEDTVGPLDSAPRSNEHDEALQAAPSDSNLEPVNSDVNHDRGERGTDIFAYANPPTPEVSPGQSRSGSSSEIAKEKPSFSEQGGPRRVGFTGEDKIDQAQPHDEKNGSDDDDSGGILDKIKSSVQDKFHLLEMKSTGPFKRLNPTSARIRASVGSGDDAKEVGIIWRSRDNRKGRNSVVIPRTSMAYPNLPSKNRPVYSSSFKGVGRNLFRMVFSFPYWDMAFWSGWSYTWGSVLFVMDGVWAWGPVGWDVKWAAEEDYVVGIFFFVGALLYQLGAVMAYLEAVNDGSFHGSAMKRFLEGHEEEKKQMLDQKVSHFFGHLNPMHEKKRHAEEEAEEKRMAEVDPSAGWKSIHRRERPGSIYPGSKLPAPRRGGVDLGEAEEGESHEYLTWRWYPTWHALRTHHIYEIGYIACSIQLFGATLYSWCGLVSVPGISSKWESDATFYGGYWLPEIFGSCCFLSASVMFLLETQEKWWRIQPEIMGWWIGLWAMIGSWGFLLNGLFGVVAQARPELDWAEFASECCTTWGSFGYLCSALCQWYEAVNKHPVEEVSLCYAMGENREC